MSRDNRDYLDDAEILDFNENLDARAAQQMEEGAISPLMFGTTGRGSPEMELRPDHMLFRDAAKVRRNEGFKDDKYLEKPKLEPFNEQQEKEAKDEKILDAYLDNMYKEMKNPVARSTSSSKKGGKRTRRRGSRRSRRSSKKRSTRRSKRKSKRSRK